MCVGGGDKAPQDELERFVYIDGHGLVYDVRKKAPGRGAWVTPTRECVEKALRGGFARAFKKRVVVPSLEEILGDMVQGIGQRLIEQVRVAIRAQRGWVGTKAVDEGMRKNISLLFIATDAGEATRRKYVANSERKGVEVIEEYDGKRLGELASRDFVAVLGLSGDFARRVSTDLKSLSTLSV